MKLELNTNVKPFKIEKTDRPWGNYILYADNKKCTVKILHIKKGEMLSMQYHFRRDQHYIILSDGFTISYSSEKVPKAIINEENEAKRFAALEKFLKDHLITVEANKGDEFGFNKCVVHRAHYHGDQSYGLVLDLAYGFNDEEDITRVYDKYERENFKSF